MHSNPISPHGGSLVNLIANQERTEELKQLCRDWPSWDLTPRQICDLELLSNGGFSPLTGFLCRKEYESVCQTMRLVDGDIWPIPIILDVTEQVAKDLDADAALVLRDPEGVVLAVLNVEDIWQPDLEKEAELVFGLTNQEHPGVKYLSNSTNPWYVGGRLECLQRPNHYDFVDLRHTPLELREKFVVAGWCNVVVFQTRNPMHRAHQEITLRAAKEIGANLLIHPVVGMTKPGDVDHYTRVRCYQKMLRHYPKNTVMLSLLPLAMRLAGPREAVWHAIIRKNCGCTHIIIGRDHAGPGSDSKGKPFYGPYEAQELLSRHEDELAIKMVPFKMMVYLEDQDKYVPQDEVTDADKVKTLSGTELRERLADGRNIPAWFSFPEIVEELRQSYPPRNRQGFTVFFTGLPSAGKSTLANVLMVRLLEMGGRPITLLDGDLVRKNLSSELTFSKEHRDLNISRIGFVASEITKNGGIAICAPIAPYTQVREQVRQLVESKGGFILVYVSTPVEICEQRDRKGLYAKARAGIIKEFTGVSDPYESPENADLVFDTTDLSPEQCVQEIILHLEKEGYIGPSDQL